jgi:DNA (cytosine-5)-methyltransferase 1
MGGLSLGFALALGARITGFDIDKWAVGAYNLNLSRFGCRAMVQDVLKWEPKGEFDLVIGGSPCQPFSLANTKKRGESHPLFPTFIRFYDIVLELKPKVFVMENVKGLITKTFVHYLTQQLSRMQDYRIRYAVLNAADYGVPQRRERLFVVGIRKDLGSFEFPEPTHAEKEYVDLNGNRVRKWITLREAIGDIMHIPPTEGKKLIQTNPRHGKLADLDEPSKTIKVDGRGGDFCYDTILVPARKMTEKQKAWYRKRWEEREFDRTILFMDSAGEVVEIPWIPYQDAYPPLNLNEPSRTIYSHIAKWSRDALLPTSEHVMTDLDPTKVWGNDWGARVMDADNPANTITEKRRSGQLLPIVYRRLTVRECLRIQSFPDWWRFPDGCSISRRYKLVGEAVPPILAYRLAVAIGRTLGLEARGVTVDEWPIPYFDRAF